MVKAEAHEAFLFKVLAKSSSDEEEATNPIGDSTKDIEEAPSDESNGGVKELMERTSNKRKRVLEEEEDDHITENVTIMTVKLLGPSLESP